MVAQGSTRASPWDLRLVRSLHGPALVPAARGTRSGPRRARGVLGMRLHPGHRRWDAAPPGRVVAGHDDRRGQRRQRRYQRRRAPGRNRGLHPRHRALFGGKSAVLRQVGRLEQRGLRVLQPGVRGERRGLGGLHGQLRAGRHAVRPERRRGRDVRLRRKLGRAGSLRGLGLHRVQVRRVHAWLDPVRQRGDRRSDVRHQRPVDRLAVPQQREVFRYRLHRCVHGRPGAVLGQRRAVLRQRHVGNAASLLQPDLHLGHVHRHVRAWPDAVLRQLRAVV